jgi:hypothetical protein
MRIINGVMFEAIKTPKVSPHYILIISSLSTKSLRVETACWRRRRASESKACIDEVLYRRRYYDSWGNLVWLNLICVLLEGYFSLVVLTFFVDQASYPARICQYHLLPLIQTSGKRFSQKKNIWKASLSHKILTLEPISAGLRLWFLVK